MEANQSFSSFVHQRFNDRFLIPPFSLPPPHPPRTAPSLCDLGRSLLSDVYLSGSKIYSGETTETTFDFNLRSQRRKSKREKKKSSPKKRMRSFRNNLRPMFSLRSFFQVVAQQSGEV